MRKIAAIKPGAAHTANGVAQHERDRCIYFLKALEDDLLLVHTQAEQDPSDVPPIKTLGFFDGIRVARMALSGLSSDDSVSYVSRFMRDTPAAVDFQP